MRWEKRKWPDRPHWEVEVERLGEDDHGLWFATRVGTPVRRGGDTLFAFVRDAVHLMPSSGVWWAACFLRDETYVDICLPVVVADDCVSFVDLDLDVIAIDGAVRVVDEDELEQHAIDLDYPRHLVIGARASATAVTAMIVGERGPFAPGVVDRWWAQARHT